MLVQTPARQQDAYGSGEYGAPRGSRKHKGIDYACCVDSRVFSPVVGLVSKLGYAYEDDLAFRYVQVTTEDGYNVRVFYIDPTIPIGHRVNKNSLIGTSQDLQVRYPKDQDHKTAITNHVHVEVFKLKEGRKRYINPLEYLS